MSPFNCQLWERESNVNKWKMFYNISNLIAYLKKLQQKKCTQYKKANIGELKSKKKEKVNELNETAQGV